MAYCPSQKSSSEVHKTEQGLRDAGVNKNGWNKAQSITLFAEILLYLAQGMNCVWHFANAGTNTVAGDFFLDCSNAASKEGDTR